MQDRKISVWQSVNAQRFKKYADRVYVAFPHPIPERRIIELRNDFPEIGLLSIGGSCVRPIISATESKPTDMECWRNLWLKLDTWRLDKYAELITRRFPHLIPFMDRPSCVRDCNYDEGKNVLTVTVDDHVNASRDPKEICDEIEDELRSIRSDYPDAEIVIDSEWFWICENCGYVRTEQCYLGCGDPIAAEDYFDTRWRIMNPQKARADAYSEYLKKLGQRKPFRPRPEWHEPIYDFGHS